MLDDRERLGQAQRSLMRGVLTAIVGLAPFMSCCTGGSSLTTSAVPSGIESYRPVEFVGEPVAKMRVVKPHGISLKLAGALLAAGPTTNPEANRWVSSVTRHAGELGCDHEKPLGARYYYSNLSETGVTATIVCDSDRSLHVVRIIFVRNSA